MIVRALVAIIVLLPSMASGAVTCGTVTSDITATDRSSATVAYTTPAGSSQTLVVLVAHRDTDNVLTGVTHAGNSMSQKTLIDHSTQVTHSAIFYVKNPTAGTNNVVVTWDGTVLASGVIIMTCAGTHSGADPFRNAGVSAEGNSAGPSVTAADSSGDITIDVMAVDVNSVAPTEGANQTAVVVAAAGSELGVGVSTQAGGLGGVMSWTANAANDWTIAAAPLREADTGSTMMMRRRE